MLNSQLQKAQTLAKNALKSLKDLESMKSQGKYTSRAQQKLKQEGEMLALEIDEFHQNLQSQKKSMPQREYENNLNEVKKLEKILQDIQQIGYTPENKVNYIKQKSQENVQSLNPEQLFQIQQQQLQDQDQQMEEFQGTLSRIKNIGYDMNEEVSVHVHLLQNIDKNVDNTQTKLERTNKNLEKLINNTSSSKLFCFLIILTVVLFIIIFFF